MKQYSTNTVLVAGSLSFAATVGLGFIWRWRRHNQNACRHSMKGSSLLSINDLTREQVVSTMKLAKRFKVIREAYNNKSKCCFANWFYWFFKARPSRPLLVGLVFMEPSTRTRCSFEAAAKRLGCSTIALCDSATSSLAKGESIEDTARMLQGYCDALVIRHPEQDIPSRIHKLLPPNFPIFNAGDGSGEHPTQALLDLFAIEQDFPGRLNNWKEKPLVVTFIGDLRHGRTIHSLSMLLAKFNAQLQFLSPDGLDIPSTVLVEATRIATSVGNPSSRHSTISSLVEALQSSDVIYASRLQKERFQEESLPESVPYNFVISSALLDMHSPKHQIILHPLPRMNEIDISVDSNPRQRYFRQAADGMFVRMALLSLALGI